MKGFLAAGIISAVTTLSGNELPTVDAKTEFRAVVNASMTRASDGLVFSDIGKDMMLTCRVKPFFAAAATGIEMRYRATGEGKAGGQVFYAVGASPFTAARKWTLPPLVRDGRWHVMRVGLDRLMDKEDWLSAGIVDTFRIDPTDSAGGKLEISYVRFVGRDESLQEGGTDGKSDQCKRAATHERSMKNEPVAVFSLGGSATPDKATAGETVHLRYDFRGPKPRQGPIELRVSLISGSSCRWEETVKVPVENIEDVGDQVWRVAFSYTLPLYINTCEVQVRAQSPSIRCVAGCFPDARLSIRRAASVPGWEKKVSATV
jgi:hypothetical protein